MQAAALLRTWGHKRRMLCRAYNRAAGIRADNTVHELLRICRRSRTLGLVYAHARLLAPSSTGRVALSLPISVCTRASLL